MNNSINVKRPSLNCRAQGFSLRQSLASQGVTEERVIRSHINFVHETLGIAPAVVDITRYRVNERDPNAPLSTLMG